MLLEEEKEAVAAAAAAAAAPATFSRIQSLFRLCGLHALVSSRGGTGGFGGTALSRLLWKEEGEGAAPSEEEEEEEEEEEVAAVAPQRLRRKRAGEG